jgi:hypothetical protein
MEDGDGALPVQQCSAGQDCLRPGDPVCSQIPRISQPVTIGEGLPVAPRKDALGPPGGEYRKLARWQTIRTKMSFARETALVKGLGIAVNPYQYRGYERIVGFRGAPSSNRCRSGGCGKEKGLPKGGTLS